MKYRAAKKVFALLMALWCAGSLCALGKELRALDRELEALEEATKEAEQELYAPENPHRQVLLVEEGDLVFFDAGKQSVIVESRHGRRK